MAAWRRARRACRKLRRFLCGPKNFVPGEYVEVAIESLHIHRHVGNGLSAVDHHASAVAVRDLDHLARWCDGTKRVRYPWQNGVAERWVGSCRRELLDNVIALNERYLKRLLSDYISYYHEDRTHLGLGKKTPSGRTPDFPRGRVIAWPRLGGLHHSYDRAA